MVFKNEKQLKEFLLKKCKYALEDATRSVYKIIDEFVREYYKDYTPEMYERTYQLFNSFVMTDVKRVGNGYEAYVYFDLDSIKYVTGNQPTAEQVMDAAKQGLHGAIGEDFLYVHGDSGNRLINIWNTPQWVIKAEAFEILKEKLIANGIPIKKG